MSSNILPFETLVLFHLTEQQYYIKMSKYKSLNIEKKVEIIAEVKKGVKSKKLIASEYGIPSSTLSTILINEQKILCSVNVVQLSKE